MMAVSSVIVDFDTFAFRRVGNVERRHLLCPLTGVLHHRPPESLSALSRCAARILLSFLATIGRFLTASAAASVYFGNLGASQVVLVPMTTANHEREQTLGIPK